MSVEIKGNESFEELEALINNIESEGDLVISDEPSIPAVLTPAAGDTSQQQSAAATIPATDTVIATAAVDALDTPTPGAGAKSVVLTKDGQHTIPYEVLEATRERARIAEEQVTKLSADAAKATQLEQQLETMKQRAVDAGLDPELMEKSGLTEEQLAEISEEYPALGKHLLAMTRQIQNLTQGGAQSTGAAPAPSSSASPVDVALVAVHELDGWRYNDPDRWEMANSIDAKLRLDPAFKDLPLVQRFREVERRTKAVFGDSPTAEPVSDVSAQADKAIAAAAAKLPGSPSDIGSSVGHIPDKAAQIAAMDGNALVHSMSSMSDSDIDSLLSSLDL